MNKKTQDRINKFFAYEQANFSEAPTLMNFKEHQLLKRGSGRSTRLIQEAVKLAISGKKVCIVAKNCRSIELQIESIVPQNSVTYFNFIPKDFNWELMHDNISKDAIWLIEHYMIEDNIQFQNMLKTITAFDVSE